MSPFSERGLFGLGASTSSISHRIRRPKPAILIDIPHVDVTVQLRALLRQTFYATRVDGTGLVFRVRNRVDPLEADRPIVRAFPP